MGDANNTEALSVSRSQQNHFEVELGAVRGGGR
jgi:hypothetical protein